MHITRSLTRIRRYARLAWLKRQVRTQAPRPAPMEPRYQFAVVRLCLAALVSIGACAWCLVCLVRGDIAGFLAALGVGALLVSGVAGALIH